MKRRNFLWLSLASTAAFMLPSLSCKVKNDALQKILSRPEVLSRFCDAKTVKEIGDSYRKKNSEENNEDQLLDLLLRDTAGKTIKTTTDIAFIRTSIRKQVEEDFKAGRITKISGWIISRTEARQCALFSLT